MIRKHHPPLTPFPVDAVYLWVDGDDPEWQRKKAEAVARLQGEATSAPPLPQATAHSRFRDNDELRYSLRSLEKFAPWIRRVFIITDGQCPTWLNTDAATIVRHKEIFPPEAAYPVFSNRPIEFCMHRIPGLAEHFISFNDDFMLGNTLHADDFFTSQGEPIVWYAEHSKTHLEKHHRPITPGVNPHTSSLALAHQMIFKRYSQKFPYRIKHYPRAVTRATMEDFCRAFPEQVAQTLQSPFRGNGDISPFPAYSFFLLATGAGKKRRINGMRQLADLFRGRYAHVGASLGDANVQTKLALIRAVSPQTFCINDADGASELCRNELQRVLQALFPKKSNYER